MKEYISELWEDDPSKRKITEKLNEIIKKLNMLIENADT